MKRVQVYKEKTDPVEIWEDQLSYFIENGWSEEKAPTKKPVKRSKKEVENDG